MSDDIYCGSCLGLLLGGGALDGDLVDVDGDVGLEAGDLLRLGLGQLPLVEPLCELGVLQVLGAADGHLQPTVEHLELETTRARNILLLTLLRKAGYATERRTLVTRMREIHQDTSINSGLLSALRMYFRVRVSGHGPMAKPPVVL